MRRSMRISSAIEDWSNFEFSMDGTIDLDTLLLAGWVTLPEKLVAMRSRVLRRSISTLPRYS